MRILYVAAILLISSCGLAPAMQTPEVLSARIAADTQSNLCTAYITPTTTPRGKLMIEAELAVRGVKQCYGASYGRSGSMTFGKNVYDRNTTPSQYASRDLRNCSDFASGAAAQKFFLANDGPRLDPNNLDADGDGLACEWGTQIKRIASYRAPIVTPRSSYTPTCYTGPRGGRYTYTSSGRKDYSRC